MSEQQLGSVPARPNVAGDRWKTVLLSLCVWLVALLLAEGAVRLWRPQITYSKLLNRVGNYYRASTENTFGLQPNFRGSEPSMAFPGRQVKVSINAAGLRGRELDPSANKIIAIGDSYTFGVYVGDDETYPAVLERLVMVMTGRPANRTGRLHHHGNGVQKGRPLAWAIPPARRRPLDKNRKR